MGYESKVYVCVKHPMSLNWYETLAGMEMCKMGSANGWRELFKTPIEQDAHWFGMDFDDYVTEDAYGDAIRYASLGDVVEWLQKEMAVSDYRRLDALYSLLKAFDDPKMWGTNIVVVHYGH